MSNENDYVPGGNEEFDTFQGILYGYIFAHRFGTAQPWGYSNTRLDVLSIKKTRWDEAWLAGKDENKRNHGDVIEMQESRVEYEFDIRDFVAEFIKKNSLITNEQRGLMGIPIDDDTPTDRAQIETSPLVKIKPLGGARIDFSARVDKDQTRSSMHPDADVVEFVFKIGGSMPTKVEDCPEVELSTKAHFTLQMETADITKKIFGFARWRNNVDKAKSGTWSEIITVTIA
jgi:hypothetical protein